MIESGVVKYSALVTDVNLKGSMKGWEIARLVRQIDPAFPIVYMTGAAADDWASEGVHPSEKAVRASAACDCCSAIAQCRRSQRLGVASQIGALWANARELHRHVGFVSI